MNVKLKMILISALIVLMLVSALGIIIIGRNKTDYGERLEQAGIYLESRDYDNAIAIYNRIISEDKSCAEAYVGLSEAYFSKDNTDKALEVLEKGARNTDNDDSIADKKSELFPDLIYASASDDDVDDEFDDDTEDDEAAAETLPLETEISETDSAVTEVTEESVTESETTVTTTEATTVPTTAATTVPTTAAPVIVTTAPPVVTAPPVTQATTRVTTTPTTVTTTTVTTTEALKDVSVPDLTRMSLDEAYEWCSKNNVILNVVGTESNSSKIVSQSPAPNSTVKENSSVIAVLDE